MTQINKSMTTLSHDPNICTECIGNKRFVAWIRQNGQRARCEIDPEHGRSRKVVPASRFAEEVDAWFRATYTQGTEEAYVTHDSDNPDYQQRGEPYEDILLNELECDGAVVHAISEHLPDASDRDIAQGADPFYDSSQNYEAIADIEQRDREAEQEYWYENRFRFEWKGFCKKVQHQRRFFQIKEPLDELFGDPKEYECGAIRPVYTLSVGQKIYRARLLSDTLTEDQLKREPAKELGPPPPERARAGRMNAEYIPAFYAAFSEDTAVAEIRPGIGEKLAVGEFVLQREVKVFDFTAFARAGHEKWKETYAHTRYDFISQMEDEISKSIMPTDRQREYIPTQIVAEYLKEYFDCEAVIYRSSMIKDGNQESRNIVLLNGGIAFVGESVAPLAFSKYIIKEVLNVTYELVF